MHWRPSLTYSQVCVYQGTVHISKVIPINDHLMFFMDTSRQLSLSGDSAGRTLPMWYMWMWCKKIWWSSTLLESQTKIIWRLTTSSNCRYVCVFNYNVMYIFASPRARYNNLEPKKLHHPWMRTASWYQRPSSVFEALPSILARKCKDPNIDLLQKNTKRGSDCRLTAIHLLLLLKKEMYRTS